MTHTPPCCISKTHFWEPYSVLTIEVQLFLHTVYHIKLLQIVRSGIVSQFSWTNRQQQNFSSEIACAIGFGHTRLATIQLRMISNELQFSFATMKLSTSNNLVFILHTYNQRRADMIQYLNENGGVDCTIDTSLELTIN